MKKPLVAILGRPNVGKSTLFNRILRKRDAIVDDQPGATRDRKYASAEWAGKEFELLDTGGYVPYSQDVFEQAIRQQIEIAINEADLVVFLLDVTAGLTPMDEEIGTILQRSGVAILVVVNKVDNDARENDIFDYYRLGLGEPIPIAAMAGRGIGDFLDKVVERLPDYKKKQEITPVINLAVLGRPNVGKSSFINAILGENKMIVTEIAGTTRDAIDTDVKYNQLQIRLVDTAGLRKRAKVSENIEFFSSVRTMNAVRRCDVALILIDAVDGLTDQDKNIISTVIEAGRGVVLGVNKWDLLEKETNTAFQMEKDMKEELRDLNYIPIIYISALTKQRVFKTLNIAVSVYEERKRRLSTSELNRFLETVTEQHHPPTFGTKWVKINYMTQIKTNPPLFAFFTNEPKGIKTNYRNYLENKLREQFGFFGVPIKMSFRKKN